MYNFSPFTFLIFLLVALFVCVALGHYLGKNKIKKKGLDVAEGAIFTLMALLITFTFSSANQRYDQRHFMIAQEVIAIENAYRRLDILPAAENAALKKDIYDYINTRINIYRAVPDFKKVNEAIKSSNQIEHRLWLNAIQATKNSQLLTAPMLILPAIDAMFDIAQTRLSYTFVHPHRIVFILLLLAVLLSAFLTGYGTSDKEHRWFSVHIVAFTIMTALMVYVIIDLEYPRLGLIREDARLDLMMVNLKDEIGRELNISNQPSTELPLDHCGPDVIPPLEVD